jgi:uncharacterized protein (TIGR02231 family)
MKNLPLLAFLAALLVAVPLSAAERDGGDPVTATLPPARAPIVRVVLYPDRALITRRATVDLARGRQVVRFEGLPLSLDRESLRATVEGSGELLAVHADTTWAEAERNAQVAELVPRIEALVDALGRRSAAGARAEAGLRQLRALGEAVRSLANEETGSAKPDLPRLSAALDGLRAELPVLLAARSEEDLAAAALSLELQELIDRLRLIGTPDYGAATRGVVRVLAPKGGRATVELSYGLADASWSPRYQLRARGESVELVVQAEVQQRTGEDWDGVQFGISTASPEGLVPAPPVPRSVATAYEREDRSRTVGSSYEERSELDEANESPVLTEGEGARVRARGAGFQVDASEAATVKADGRTWRVVLARSQVPAERDLYVAPERGVRVLRRVRTTNGAGLALLPGPVDVFGDSGFIGTTQLEGTPAGAPLAVSLGAEEGLTVLRRLDRARRDEVEIGLRKKVHYDVRVEATNTGTEPRTFVVEERVPVSRLKELKVKIQDETTAGYELDAEQGFVRWTVTLAPGAEREVRLYYVLDMPKDFAWQGP